MIGNKIQPFKIYCQKVLPNVYDDSLSYYEYLCKMNEYLNEVIEQMNTLTEAEEQFQTDLTAQWTTYKTTLSGEWTTYKTELTAEWNEYKAELTQAWTETKNYIDNYFDNLDVQEEINNKLDEMVTDGTFTNLINPIVAEDIPTLVTNWLTAHVDPVGSSVIVDDTLSIEGASADAKATGLIIAPLYSTSNTYKIGDYVNYNGTIYKCNTDITTAEAWNSSHWDLTNVTNEIETINDKTEVLTDVGLPFKTLVDNSSDFVNTSHSIIHGGEEGTFANYNTTDYIECTVGEVLAFRLLGYYRQSIELALDTIAFFDDNYDYVTGIYYENGTRGTGTIFEGTVTVPNNAKYFKALTHDEVVSNPFVERIGTGLFKYEKLEGTPNKVLLNNLSAFVNTNRSVLHGGETGTFANYNTTDYIECKSGDKLIFKLWGYNRISANVTLDTIAFYDENYNYLNGIYYVNGTTGTGRVYENETIVPNGSKYLKALMYDSEFDNPYIIKLASGLFEVNNLKTNVKVAFVGDSLTQGMTGGDSSPYSFADKPYPMVFKNFLRNRGFEITVKNYGRRGLSPLTYWNNAIPVDGNYHNPTNGEPGDTIEFDNSIDAVIIMLGTNGHLEEGGSSQAQQYEAYCNIIEYIMANTNNHAQIILVAPIYANNINYEEKLINTLPTIIELGEKYQIPVINGLYESGLGKYNATVFYNTTDGIHLNQAGYEKFGTFIASKFTSLYSTFDMNDLPT